MGSVYLKIIVIGRNIIACTIKTSNSSLEPKYEINKSKRNKITNKNRSWQLILRSLKESVFQAKVWKTAFIY